MPKEKVFLPTVCGLHPFANRICGNLSYVVEGYMWYFVGRAVRRGRTGFFGFVQLLQRLKVRARVCGIVLIFCSMLKI